MAARVTATEVKNIIQTDLSDTVIDAYIAAANELVTDVLGDSTKLTDALKKEIERWMTAHLMATTQVQQLEQAKAGPTSVVFQGKTGMGLQASMYGQQVMILDSTGKFARLGNKRMSINAIPIQEDWSK